MPEWGAMYYDSKTDTWNDFGSANGAWKFPGKPRFTFELIYIFILSGIIASSAKGIFLDFLLSVGTILRVESIEII